ncbi:signal recognition particle-docking protein FtsY [Anaerobranca californiensis DSM 14826]|jgi:fused signal recognition particle receptor|uniref:Signal recognition particle receptor FtsY n=1 Tax=Anaerobranca californiensis DSM 14826 TaxID=1120989 RepID=A0A1M6KMP0_9FIRM|nr:signal recognition particle-docking protein FtsY [Anaerobranca californiensis]SHJ60229.1 signal recognition particle-docking protein FtsY [Anaerobranca californiensis DSM 14826]
MSFLNRLKEGLNKTRNNIMEGIDKVLSTFTKLDEEFFEELEEVLLSADVGISTTMELIDELREYCKKHKITDSNDLKKFFKEQLSSHFTAQNNQLAKAVTPPTVILVCGVNGVGKTTTIGKLTNMLKNQGNKVLLVAADTFRAAAIEQLKIWGQRNNVDVISHQMGSDPSAVIYDGLQAAKSRKVDYVICDTAGRLHSKVNLMEELKKINRVIKKEIPDGPHESLLVLDATTGQNAMMQAKAFSEATDLTGVVLTKLDGTAKGGIVIAINRELKIPIKFVGVGEGIDDLKTFDGQEYVNALFD